MGWFTAAVRVVQQEFKKQEEKYDWGSKVSDTPIIGKVYDTTNDYYQKGRETATAYAKKAGVDKPYGSFKEGTDVIGSWYDKAKHHAHGDKYPGQGISDGQGGNPEDYLAGSRANYLRKGQYAKTEKESDRRSLDKFDTGTLLTQGQKAKKVKNTA